MKARLGNLERYERITPLYDLLDLGSSTADSGALGPRLFRRFRILDVGVGTRRNVCFKDPPMGRPMPVLGRQRSSVDRGADATHHGDRC